MQHFNFGLRVLLIVMLAALVSGVVVGFILGWIVWPVQMSNVDAADLKPSAQDDFIVLIANSYVYDHDLTRARERLAELKDTKIEERIVSLVKKYNAVDDSNAADLAALAVALGNTDQQIVLIATTATPTPSLTPTPTDTTTPTITPSATPTFTPSPTLTPTVTHTPRPRVTATPKPAPIAATEWIPAYPAGWPVGVSFTPANVAPGQKYWHLTRALFCDIMENDSNCADLPGGIEGIGVYVILVDGKAPLLRDGKVASDLEDKSSDPQCHCTYVDFPNGQAISVANYPSDTIRGMALKSVKEPRPQTHVRYFLTFQLVTR